SPPETWTIRRSAHSSPPHARSKTRSATAAGRNQIEPPGKRRTLLEQRPEVTLDLIVMVPWEDQQRSMHPRSATIPRPVRSRRSPCLTPASMTPAPHTTTLLLADGPVRVVATRLGHTDPAIALRVYTHVICTAEARA